MSGIPEFGTGQHEDYLSWKDEQESAEDGGTQQVTPGQAATLAELVRGWRDLMAELADSPMSSDEAAEYETLRVVSGQVEAAIAAAAQGAPGHACPDPSQHRDVYGQPLPMAPQPAPELAAVLADRHELSGLNAWQGAEIGRLREALAEAAGHVEPVDQNSELAIARWQQLAAGTGQEPQPELAAAMADPGEALREAASRELAAAMAEARGYRDALTQVAKYHDDAIAQVRIIAKIAKRTLEGKP